MPLPQVAEQRDQDSQLLTAHSPEKRRRVSFIFTKSSFLTQFYPTKKSLVESNHLFTIYKNRLKRSEE
jgi:hypothetical protein